MIILPKSQVVTRVSSPIHIPVLSAVLIPLITLFFEKGKKDRESLVKQLFKRDLKDDVTRGLGAHHTHMSCILSLSHDMIRCFSKLSCL